MILTHNILFIMNFLQTVLFMSVLGDLRMNELIWGNGQGREEVLGGQSWGTGSLAIKKWKKVRILGNFGYRERILKAQLPILSWYIQYLLHLIKEGMKKNKYLNSLRDKSS